MAASSDENDKELKDSADSGDDASQSNPSASVGNGLNHGTTEDPEGETATSCSGGNASTETLKENSDGIENPDNASSRNDGATGGEDDKTMDLSEVLSTYESDPKSTAHSKDADPVAHFRSPDSDHRAGSNVEVDIEQRRKVPDSGSTGQRTQTVYNYGPSPNISLIQSHDSKPVDPTKTMGISPSANALSHFQSSTDVQALDTTWQDSRIVYLVAPFDDCFIDLYQTAMVALPQSDTVFREYDLSKDESGTSGDREVPYSRHLADFIDRYETYVNDSDEPGAKDRQRYVFIHCKDEQDVENALISENEAARSGARLASINARIAIGCSTPDFADVVERKQRLRARGRVNPVTVRPAVVPYELRRNGCAEDAVAELARRIQTLQEEGRWPSDQEPDDLSNSMRPRGRGQTYTETIRQRIREAEERSRLVEEDKGSGLAGQIDSDDADGTALICWAVVFVAVSFKGLGPTALHGIVEFLLEGETVQQRAAPKDTESETESESESTEAVRTRPATEVWRERGTQIVKKCGVEVGIGENDRQIVSFVPGFSPQAYSAELTERQFLLRVRFLDRVLGNIKDFISSFPDQFENIVSILQRLVDHDPGLERNVIDVFLALACDDVAQSLGRQESLEALLTRIDRTPLLRLIVHFYMEGKQPRRVAEGLIGKLANEQRQADGVKPTLLFCILFSIVDETEFYSHEDSFVSEKLQNIYDDLEGEAGQLREQLESSDVGEDGTVRRRCEWAESQHRHIEELFRGPFTASAGSRLRRAGAFRVLFGWLPSETHGVLRPSERFALRFIFQLPHIVMSNVARRPSVLGHQFDTVPLERVGPGAADETEVSGTLTVRQVVDWVLNARQAEYANASRLKREVNHDKFRFAVRMRTFAQSYLSQDRARPQDKLSVPAEQELFGANPKTGAIVGPEATFDALPSPVFDYARNAILLFGQGDPWADLIDGEITAVKTNEGISLVTPGRLSFRAQSVLNQLLAEVSEFVDMVCTLDFDAAELLHLIWQFSVGNLLSWAPTESEQELLDRYADAFAKKAGRQRCLSVLEALNLQAEMLGVLNAGDSFGAQKRLSRKRRAEQHAFVKRHRAAIRDVRKRLSAAMRQAARS